MVGADTVDLILERQVRMSKIFICGGAGFIGSNLVDLLVKEEHTITVYDNLSSGKKEFIASHLNSGAANLIIGDALNLEALTSAIKGHDLVIHLAANPDIRWALKNTKLDLEQGLLTTYNVLEAARLNNVKNFIFSSSGTVYGNITTHSSELDLGHLPVSLYGASKLAAEALISSFVECFDFKAVICRFGNVVGGRATHGAILDFCNKLKAHPNYLDVLGDGTATKPYVYVSDIVAGVWHAWTHNIENLGVYNISPPDAVSVRFIAERTVVNSPFPSAKIQYGEGSRGWVGDVPMYRLNADKIKGLGFNLQYTSEQAVEKSIKDIVKEVFR